MKILFKHIAFASLLLEMLGCEKYADNYKQYLGNGEVIYPGLAQHVHYQAGNLRTVLIWNPSPDPNIKDYVIRWNNGADSLQVVAATHDPADSIVVSIPNLSEYVYTFTIVAFDNDGNVSVGQELNNVRIYGPLYQSTLLNRLVKSAVKNGNDALIEFFAGSEDSPYAKITYTTSANEQKVINVTSDMAQVVLANYKSQSQFQLQTYYLPDSTAIDTFRVAPDTYGVDEDVTAAYIKNPGKPFLRADDGTGKWGLLKDWLYNANVVNQNGSTAGGWSTDDGGVIHFETQDWGGAGVTNGKIYQTVTLPAGTYALEVETGNYGGDMQVNEVVALGETLPDMGDLSNALASFSGNEGNIGGTHTLNFTLQAPTTVAIGWVVNTGQYTYLQFRGVTLKKLNSTN
ncbi:protein of unknown function [bacterium A37T11]|nr:protein of unknown function [bacterium A37T11]